MGEIINFLERRKESKWGRNLLEPRLLIPAGKITSKLLVDEEKEIAGNVIDIGAGGLALLVDTLDYDLERGSEIEKVIIQTSDGNIFEANGYITHVTPLIKEKEFTNRLGLAFRREESPTLEKLIISKTDRQFDILAKEEEMARVIEDLILIGDEAKIGVKINSHINVEGGFKKGSELKKIKSFVIEFNDEKYCMSFEIEKEFTFYFNLFRSFYVFRSSVLGNRGNSIEVAIPDFFVKLMRRDTSRIRFNQPDAVFVSIKHPLLPERNLRKAVFDMNEKGFSIIIDKSDFISPVGTSLHEMTVEIPGKEPIKIFGRLAHLEPEESNGFYKCGIKFFERDPEKLRPITEYVFFKRFPLLFPVDNKNYDGVWELFERSGYLDEKDRQSFELVREESKPAWEKLDVSGGLLSRNVASTDGEKITGGMHLTRVYSNSLLLHHFCILPGYQRTITTSIYGGMIDQLLESSVKYSVCYYNADKSWNQKNYDEFINEYPYKEENYTKIYDLFEFDLTKQELLSPDDNKQFTIHTANDFDLKGIARFFEMNKNKIQIDAMDLSSENLKMQKLGEEYKRFGMERRRQFFIAKKGKEMVGFVILDIATTGINIYALTDSFRVYLINPDDPNKEEIIKMLSLQSLNYFKTAGKKTVLFYSNDKDISFLAPAKHHRLCSIALWIAHRNCFTRYSEYNGALFGRIMARRKRIHEQAKKEKSE